MTKFRVLENPDTGDIIFFNKIIKIKQYDMGADGFYKYQISTSDNGWTDFYTRTPKWHMLIREYKV